jgi:hypothetical protein
VIDEWMERRTTPQPTPADGDDYTYDVRTPAALRLDDAARRVRALEQQVAVLNWDIYGPYPLEMAHERAALFEEDIRQEVRTIAKRLQHVEYLLEQWRGDG